MQRSAVVENPFTPTFGEVPAHMAGRSVLLNDLKRAFSSTGRHPNLTTVVTGARGTGKTALLALAAEAAQERGWVVAKTVALPGMLEDVLIAARRAASHIVPDAGGAKMTGLGLGQLAKVEWERSPQPTNWRNEMTTLLEGLEEAGSGMLITVDEVQPRLDEMVQLAAVYQLFVTDRHRVALLMAGLPHNMLQLENDKTVSFLRRAQKAQLGRIADFEVADAMRQTIADSGRSISQEALNAAVRASEGFPFMMQLVGFRMWDARPDEPEITEEDAERGIGLARAEMLERIVKPTYEALSAGDRSFLAAMMALDGPCPVSEVAAAMGKSHSYATQYKKRLLDQGVISQGADGRVTFELPLMRDYLVSMR